MIGRAVRLASTIATVLVVLGFMLFALDEAGASSRATVAELADRPAPSAAGERERERKQGSLREAIDDVNDVLLAPFAGVADSGNTWVRHGVPALLAFLAYGLLLRFVANLVPRGRRREPRWDDVSGGYR